MKIRHVLGISGGKDSAALAIYLKDKYPQLDIEYYSCDTGKELDETYALIKKLENYLEKEITILKAAAGSHESPFDHFLKYKGQFLPSSFNRWCTKNLKLDPFEKWVGEDLVISYVGIRGDEDREGYISHKSNIQSIFPFRRNIWSEDVVSKVLKNQNIPVILEYYAQFLQGSELTRALEIAEQPLSTRFTQSEKLNSLLNINTKAFNRVVFSFLKCTKYPIANLYSYSLLDDDQILVKDDIFQILTDSGVGVPNYYHKVQFKVDGEIGEYARSRSGCYFCFYQQRIEWVWLYEQHPGLFYQAMEYEKEGYTWGQNESLADLIKPERIAQIKREYLLRMSINQPKSPYLLDILDDAEGEGCAACFI
ncbi:MAG TPA: phosphoadenosine phosphosulfate reductase family protein [Flavitalea sp.]|nr:phosphoadenosine phosphosulfate reductase family protein [Flavitalea sp.]HTF28940.1 phosphoadenosine phosphosulfate reductase family protein [Flavitalea sp.]